MTNFITRPMNGNYGDCLLSDTMPEPNKLSFRLAQTRNELNNIRKVLQSMKAQHKLDIEKLQNLFKSTGVLDELHSSNLFSNSNFKYGNIYPIADKSSETNYPNQISLINSNCYLMKPIGFIRSLHHHKNGTPRQGSVLHLSRGKLEIEKDVFNNPSHSLDGIHEFSHVWIIYFFNQNIGKAKHSKVAPPRLDGKKVGVFSTRSPHRPNGIGLTLAKLDKLEGTSIQLSGIDMLDGTPVLDIKPYIPQYDCPSVPLLQENEAIPDKVKLSGEIEVASLRTEVDLQINYNDQNYENNLSSHIFFDDNVGFNGNISLKTSHHSKVLQKETVIDNQAVSTSTCNYPILRESDVTKEDVQPYLAECISHQANKSDLHDSTVLNFSFHDNSHHKSIRDSKVTIASWLCSPPVSSLEVLFNPIAEKQIKQFSFDAEDSNYRLEYLKSHIELRTAISSVLSEDPRSTYRRQKCQDRLYFFMVDTAHITTWFFQGVAEVLRVHPPSEATSCIKLV